VNRKPSGIGDPRVRISLVVGRSCARICWGNDDGNNECTEPASMNKTHQMCLVVKNMLQQVDNPRKFSNI
jgi:hypothetical protein